MKELKIKKQLITDPEVPLRLYNYSYIANRLLYIYSQKVSVPTIIDRAKRSGYYLKKPKRKAHNRELPTNYVGELIQHDSSHHKWSLYAKNK
ncbi:MAG: hypothetical protein HQ569_04155 [Actinobacteria bacterium]|nr:hypothetical protein [Actinomycetota bacterium]